MIFYKDYNLLIYFKSAITTPKAIKRAISKAFIKEINSSEFNNSSNSRDNLLDIKKVKR